MKPVLLLLLFTALGLAAAGCGSTQRTAATRAQGLTVITVSNSSTNLITVSGSTSLGGVETGALVRCTGWGGKGVRVPRPGESVAAFGTSYTIPGKKTGSEEMTVTHRRNGSVAVSCKRTH